MLTPHPQSPNQDLGTRPVLEMLASAMRIANRAVVADIESDGTSVTLDGQRYYDTRPMLDEREVSAPCVDMALDAINYAVYSGLAVRHPQHPHLVRITPQGLQC